MKGERDVTMGKELETNFEHYHKEIEKLIKTHDCTDCPVHNSCDVLNGDICVPYFAKWAMSKFRRSKTKKKIYSN